MFFIGKGYLTCLRCAVRWARPLWLFALVWGIPQSALAGDFTALTNTLRVEFTGLQHTELESQFKQASDVYTYRNSPPPTEGLLRMRIQLDEERFRTLLNAQGYYRAELNSAVSGTPDNRLVTVNVVLREPFVYGSVVVELTNAVPSEWPVCPSPKALGLSPDGRALFSGIRDAEERLANAIREQGYPFVQIVSRRVEADYAAGCVNVDWVVDPGRRSRFGDVSVTGLNRVHRSLINRMTPWRKGDVYDPRRVKMFQDMLSGCGLFSVVMLSSRPGTNAVQDVEMVLDVSESARRSVGFGVGYDTEKGAGVSANWEHRNLWGNGETLHTEGNYSEKQLLGEVGYEIPHFFHRAAALKTFSRIGEDRPRAYEARYWKTQAGMSWDVTPVLNLSLAYAWKIEQVTQFGETKEYYLQSMPVNLLLDYRDDRVEPTGGGVFFAGADYVTDWNDGRRFIREQGRFRPIVKIWNHPQMTLSGMAGAGSLQGGDVTDIPADERFYAGGSDTLRGYAYQMAGPLVDDDPTGGCSMLTLSAEWCVKVYGPVGLVAFVDGGNVFSQSMPDTHEDLLWGAGGGLRVFTPVGSIGVEMGIPLNPRPVDDPRQFYITIGLQF